VGITAIGQVRSSNVLCMYRGATERKGEIQGCQHRVGRDVRRTNRLLDSTQSTTLRCSTRTNSLLRSCQLYSSLLASFRRHGSSLGSGRVCPPNGSVDHKPHASDPQLGHAFQLPSKTVNRIFRENVYFFV